MTKTSPRRWKAVGIEQTLATTSWTVLSESIRRSSQRELCRIIRHLGSGISRTGKRPLRLFELARVLVRLDHIASVIVNAT